MPAKMEAKPGPTRWSSKSLLSCVRQAGLESQLNTVFTLTIDCLEMKAVWNASNRLACSGSRWLRSILSHQPCSTSSQRRPEASEG